MSLEKKYLKTRPVSKVTFRLSREAARGASQVCLVGEFNDWDASRHPMTCLKNGDFKLTLDLEVGREYNFRYLLDDAVWENDNAADKYVSSGFPDVDNSVVVV